MKIVSKFHDYYDTMRSIDQSNYPLYVRETKELEARNISPVYFRWLSNMQTNNRVIDFGYIAFCGKLYPFYQLYNLGCFYTFKAARKRLIEKIDAAKQEKDTRLSTWETTLNYLNNPTMSCNRFYFTRSYEGIFSEENWDKMYEEAMKFKVADEIFRKFNVPVFSCVNSGGQYIVTLNPCLRAMNFAAALNPYTAWQELSMYLGNILVTQKDPDIKISDELKAQSKGFDKWSFRKKVR